jgi:hypothetical protein
MLTFQYHLAAPSDASEHRSVSSFSPGSVGAADFSNMKLTISHRWLGVTRLRLQRGRGKALLAILRCLIKVTPPSTVVCLHFCGATNRFLLLPLELPKATYDDLMEQISDLKE